MTTQTAMTSQHPMTSEQTVANALLKAGCVFFVPDAPITFASGILSPVYMDTRRLLAYPELWSQVIDLMSAGLSVQRDGPADGSRSTPPSPPEVIAGVAVGGIPHSTAVAVKLGLPSCFVRKQAKEHGRGKNIEGADVKGRKVALVEDVITTGGSSLEAIAALQDAGAEVIRCVAIAGYELDNARENFSQAGAPLSILAPFRAVLEAATQTGDYSESEIAEATRWFSDPHNWQPKVT